MIRQGCSRLASLAASMASSSSPDLVTTTRVSTRPRAITPPCSRRAMIFLEILEVVVSGRSTIMAFSRFVRHGQGARRRRQGPSFRGVGFGLLVQGRPVVLERVQDLPGQFDFRVAREQRRLAEQHVEDEPFVGLRAGLGEGVAVAEVHGDVADFHLRARDLGPEADGGALVGLDPDHDGVLAEVVLAVVGEEQVAGRV